MATPAAPAAAAAAAAAAPAGPVTLTKVFVGNLSFKTREAELAQAFSGAGKVLNANIITRGPRSLGYGFVEFGSDAEAKKAVELLNKKELDGREINVEVAKPREDGGDDAPKTSGAPRRGGGAAGGQERGGRRGGAQGGQPGGGRRGGAQQGGAPAPAGAQAGSQPPRSGDYLPRRRTGGGGFRGGRGGGVPRQGGGAAGGAPGSPGQSANNGAPRSSSATTLFVANLPFLVDDKGLEDLFKEFAPVSAHVVKKRNGKSKGFGFVELKGPEDQAKALAAMDKKEVQGRELIVKVALTEQVAKEQAAAAGSPAPVAAAPAAAAPKASPQTDKKQ